MIDEVIKSYIKQHLRLNQYDIDDDGFAEIIQLYWDDDIISSIDIRPSKLNNEYNCNVL